MKKSLISALLTLTLFSCTDMVQDFSKARLGMTEKAAIELWGKPGLTENLKDKKIITWKNDNDIILSLWLDKNDEKTAAITVSKHGQKFKNKDKWFLIENITGTRQNLWKLKGTTETANEIYSKDKVDVLMSHQSNGFIIIKEKSSQSLFGITVKL